MANHDEGGEGRLSLQWGSVNVDSVTALKHLLRWHSRECESSRTNICCSESLVRRQVPPLAQRQRSERHVSDADALQAKHFQSDHLAHPADLPLLSLCQHESQLRFVLPRNRRRLQQLAIEAQAVIEL